MSEGRTYVSPKREAQAAATRDAILEAFADQLTDTNRATLSPTEAAEQVGVSVRTVHNYFPDADAQMIGLGEWFDRRIYPQAVQVAQGPDDLARYFRDIHANALKSPIARALAEFRSPVWNEVRQRRRAARLDAIRRSVKEIGAPKSDTEDATAMLLILSGAEISWPMHETYGLPIERIADTIARTVQLVVDQLKTKARTAR
ncbi:MAG: TetR/AcrR family transcriptional regulator [Acidimicrobiales bacterium]